MPQNLGPDAERRIVLKHFAVTEVEIKRLRKMASLTPDEARFYIDHEHTAQMTWLERRTAFIQLEVFGPPPKPTSKRGAGIVVTLRTGPGKPVTGEKMA